MSFTFKSYKLLKILQFTKLKDFFFITQSVNKNSKNWIETDQTIKKAGFKYFKVTNKIINLSLNNSIYQKIIAAHKSLAVFLVPEKIKHVQTKNALIKKWNALLFIFLLVKLNNKIYSSTNLKHIHILAYKKNMILFYQNSVFHTKNFKITL